MNMWKAARIGDVERLQRAIDVNGDVDIKDCKGHTPFWWACWCGNKECAMLLIDAGADTSPQQHLLEEVAYNGHTPILEMLLLLGSVVTAKAVWNAVFTRHWSCALFLLRHPSCKGLIFKDGTLCLALARRCSLICVRMLIDMGCPVAPPLNNPKCSLLKTAIVAQWSRTDDNGVAALLMRRDEVIRSIRPAVDHRGRATLFDWAPKWAIAMPCRWACIIVTALCKLRSPMLGGNGRDALQLLAKYIWALRRDTAWFARYVVEGEQI